MGNRKKTTIKDVAKQAGVSIATVSHVINKTRFVTSELVEQVQNAITVLDYKNIPENKKQKLGNSSIMVLLIPDLEISIFRDIANRLEQLAENAGFSLTIDITHGKIEQELNILRRVLFDKRTGGVFLVPSSDKIKNYAKLIRQETPLVCIVNRIADDSIFSVTFDAFQAGYQATQLLIKNHHADIRLLMPPAKQLYLSGILAGFKQALADNHLLYHSSRLVSDFNSVLDQNLSCAFVSCTNVLTTALLKALQERGKECPGDFSIVSIGEDSWFDLVEPPVTSFAFHTTQLVTVAFSKLQQLMTKQIPQIKNDTIGGELQLRKSVKVLDSGPFGEEAVSPDEIDLCEQEKEKLRKGNFRVAISFHYGGTAWTRLHEQGIRDTLEQYGVNVVSVMDAQFDPELQVAQLQSIELQKPDALIAIPADDAITAPMFQKLSQLTKLIFISNVPEGLHKNSYVSCVSVNERENGYNAGLLLGSYLKNKAHPQVGFIIHGTPFYGTHLRDSSAEQLIRENYKNIIISDIEAFLSIAQTYTICKKMIENHPEIEALYISWDQPALHAIRALEEMGRTDIAIFTFDLDYKIASYLAGRNMVRGLSTQRPYEQGIATALATVKALVSDKTYKYIGVQPYIVKPKNLAKAWKEIMHETLPADIEQELKKHAK